MWKITDENWQSFWIINQEDRMTNDIYGMPTSLVLLYLKIFGNRIQIVF